MYSSFTWNLFCHRFLGALEYLYKVIPEELQATGHMVFVGISFGITGIIGSSVGGIIFENFGDQRYISY